jgi:hypothetical protein
VVLGSATITGSCAPDMSDHLLELRRTSRLPYHDRTVDAPSIATLVGAAARGGHRVITQDDRRIVASSLDWEQAHAKLQRRRARGDSRLVPDRRHTAERRRSLATADESAGVGDFRRVRDAARVQLARSPAVRSVAVSAHPTRHATHGPALRGVRAVA